MLSLPQENVPKTEEELAAEDEDLKQENERIAGETAVRGVEEEIGKMIPSLAKQFTEGTLKFE